MFILSGKQSCEEKKKEISYMHQCTNKVFKKLLLLLIYNVDEGNLDSLEIVFFKFLQQLSTCTVESFLFMGQMLVDYQNFAASLGCNFLVKWFFAVVMQDDSLLWYTFEGMEICGQVQPMKSTTLMSHEQ